MIPTANYFRRLIDCRRLSIAGDFFLMKEDQILQLYKDVYSFINAHFSDQCILSWDAVRNNKSKKIKSVDDLQIAVPDRNILVGLDCYGDVRSERVYNKTSLRKYENDLIYRSGSSPVPMASVDYPQYAERELDPYRDSPAELRDALIRTFSLEGCINKDINDRHDIAALVCVKPMIYYPDYYTGELNIDVSVLSLDDELNDMAETFRDFGIQLSETYTNINLSVEVFQTYQHEYMSYFGYLIAAYSFDKRRESGISVSAIEEKNNHVMRKNACYMYSNRIGWSNILSPQVRSLLPIALPSAPIGSNVEKLRTGALRVSLDRRISETTLEGLKQIKKYLYPALFPGLSIFSKDNVGRWYWQNVPVLDDEIKIAGDKVVFTHLGDCNEDYLLQGPTLS